MARPFVLAVALAAAVLATPAATLAAAPQPRKPVEIASFMGRWYEQARTPNPNQKNCFAATMDWKEVGAGRYSVVQTCRKGSAGGATQTWTGSARVVDAKTRAKLNVGFFGGLVKQEYWVLDHADDYAWAIIGTPGGNYVWLLTRERTISSGRREELIGQVRSLGYDPGKLQFAGA
jgi:apolipoprotein D and lipocalin family protein